MKTSSLVLGGHSFIEQLGNEPRPSEEMQCDIVEACLDNGVHWFDTTYQPERVALGKALALLGRRNEATILAWNFFDTFRSGEPVGTPDYYREHHIELILEQLRTDYVDGLIVHELDDADENARQEQLALSWVEKGYARFLGLWVSRATTETSERLSSPNPYRCVVAPHNIVEPGAASLFSICRSHDIEFFATSPFGRGWALDRLVASAVRLTAGDQAAIRSRLANLMLRYAHFHPKSDRIVVSMRRPEWVQTNIDIVRQGPLHTEELDWLEAVKNAASPD
ncbi:aldo/keto reductase [Mesorhizobium sp. BHbdii]